MEIFTEEEKLFIRVVNNFKEDLTLMKRYKELFCILMEINMLDHFQMAKNMVKAVTFIRQEMFTKDSLNKIKSKDLEF